MCEALAHMYQQLAYRYQRTGHCPGVHTEEAKRTCESHHQGYMLGIKIPRTQPGICGEAFAVTAGLAEPSSRSNISQANTFSAR